jgi:hypothetical protein
MLPSDIDATISEGSMRRPLIETAKSVLRCIVISYEPEKV